MSLPRILNNEVIVALLTRFADLYPGIALRIMFTDEKSNMVRDGLDLVLRVGSLEDSSLKARKLGDIPCFLVASPDYVAKQKKLTHAKDLEEWKFIRHEYIKDEIEMTHPQEGKVVVLGKDQISVDSSSAIIGFALAGAGVAVVLDFSVKQALEEGRLVKLLPEWKLMAPGIYAVYPANSSRNSLARKLVDYLIQNLPNARGRVEGMPRSIDWRPAMVESLGKPSSNGVAFRQKALSQHISATAHRPWKAIYCGGKWMALSGFRNSEPIGFSCFLGQMFRKYIQ